VVQEHLLGQGHALAQREQLQHLIFLAGQMHARAVDLDRLSVEIDEIAGPDARLGMTLGTRVDARDQFVPVERLSITVAFCLKF
jgi:microcystin degradation protein MlrC